MNTMDLPAAWCQVCVCGRTFSVPQAYTCHTRSCQKTNKRLASALEKAKGVWRANKRRKIEEKAARETLAGPSHPNTDFGNLDPTESSTPMALESTIDSIDVDRSIAERRIRRPRRLPKRIRDMPPNLLAALPPSLLPPTSVLATPPSALPLPSTSTLPKSSTPLSSALSRVRKILKSTRNLFGLYRQYHATQFPEHDPDENVTFDDLMDTSADSSSSLPVSYSPYPTESSFLLGEWYWNDGVKKSQSSFNNLLKIVGHPDFRPEDVAGANWRRINAQLAEGVWGDGPNTGDCEDGWEDERVDGDWIKTPIKITVPFHKKTLNPGSEEFEAGMLYHRKLISVIREKISRPCSHPHLHFEPYELYWQPNETTEPVRTHGELYASDAFFDAHRALQDSPGEPGCQLPRVVVGLMFASDGTELTAFSNAKLWPVYLALGNESKNRRSKPSCQAFEHVAYFETLPGAFKAFASERIGGKGPNGAFMAHCHRELYHAQWAVMLDDEFAEAYVHGIVIDCCDGIRRRFYPRIFTYSADYREKILIAGIRNLGHCPCPRCLIPIDRVANMGKPRDMMQRKTLARVDNMTRRNRVASARECIYERNYAVDSAAVQNLLKEDSLVPTANAFSSKLAQFGFCLYTMLVVDLMHEFELGVWKAVFIHLLRILDCQDEARKYELDRRFQEIPPFGLDGIRKITSNRSELKKMTAHDYEDMVQCAIPVFDGLLPEPHNTRILKLLFDLAHWHALAKLRMHTDATLDILSQVTTSLGNGLREFEEETCTMFQTRELERERAARQRRQENTANNGTKPKPKAPSNNSARKSKQFNLNTYKLHALGDYVSTIRLYGTTDSYSTQRSELEHKTSKARFSRTSGRLIPLQLSRIERRQRRICTIREKMHRPPRKADPENIADDPRAPYNIGKTENSPVHVPTFLQRNNGDPAIKNFLPKLRGHLLPRIQNMILREATSLLEHSGHETSNVGLTPTLNNDACNFVFLKKDRIYHHKLSRFHFTTYDVRRGTDIINPGTSHCNIMLLADNVDCKDGFSSSHHFLYARVLGVYHANVIYTGPGMRDYETRRLDFLWVRWYEIVDPKSSGWSTSTLDSVCFPPLHGDDAFGFVDPKDVLRGCHIMPNFAKGKRQADGIGISRCAKDSQDYNRYYIGRRVLLSLADPDVNCIPRFSERDILMRYHWGLGVGHIHAHEHAAASVCIPEEDIQLPECEAENRLDDVSTQTQENNDNYDSDDPELGLEDRDLEGWEDVEADDSEGEGEDENVEEEDFAGM